VPSDRSIAAIVREALGAKAVIRFFPNPDPDTDPPTPGYVPYNELAFDELVERALRWLGKQAQIRLSAEFELPESGQLALDDTPGGRILHVISVRQGDDVFPELRPSWGEGTPTARGAWRVDEASRTFYAVGVGKSPLPFASPSRPGWPSAYSLGSGPVRLLKPGPVTLTYYGIPTEAQIDANEELKQVVVDYSVYLAFERMIPRIHRVKRVKLEGVPDIIDNAREYRREADARRKAAEHAVAELGIAIV
jgi:hypothetical protein